jgi:hypothetical protein
MPWPGQPEELWTRLYKVSAPMRPRFDSFPKEVRADGIREVFANFEPSYDRRQVVTRTRIIFA